MKTNTLRIIGGQYRSRRIHFPDAMGLRPTPDRVRETLFNWLMDKLAQRHCLDLFAGSGALGFEALSRGAGQVTLVDNNRQIIQALHHAVQQLNATNAQVVQASALDFLQRTTERFDVVLLDPPFGLQLQQQAIDLLAVRLQQSAWVYVEDQKQPTYTVPTDWQLYREGIAGDVCFRLYLFKYTCRLAE